MIDSVYISGPITSMPNLNKHNFSVAEAVLQYRGYQTCNPFVVNRSLPDDSLHSDFMRVDIAELVKCQRIYMLHGWWHSRGAIVELIVAKACGLKIMWEK